MTEREDVNGNDTTMVAPAAGSIFPTNYTESLRQQNSRAMAPLLTRQSRYYSYYKKQGTLLERLPTHLVLNRDRGSSHLLAPPTPPYRRVRIRRFSKLSPEGPEVRVVVRHKGFAALQVPVSASPSSEPVKLSRS